jgi:N-acyl-D-aspartate/D-glutamate deacylase
MRRQIAAGALAAALLAGIGTAGLPKAVQGQAPAYDLLIRGGTVVDGTGAPRFPADVAIKGDRIVRVDRSSIPAEEAAQVLDARGLIVAPGFIDHHAHIQTTIHEYPLAENFLRQGITTILASLHSGAQPWPLRDYMATLQVAPNIGFFAGHSFAREQVIGRENRSPTPAELERMKALVEESMRDGALGLSTGLVYVPANFAKTEEVIELAKVAARYGGIYVSHMRDEATGLLESVAELIRISREAGLPAQINHHKAVGATQLGWSERTLAMIDSARTQDLDIKHDLYPYTASSTGSAVLFPQWALAGGHEEFSQRIADPAVRARIEREMREIFEKERGGGDLSRVQFRTVPSEPAYNGRTLADLAADRGLPNNVESGIRLVIDLQLAGGFSAIYHAMDEGDVIRIMQHPYAMFETDGDPVGYGIGYPHPRSYGAFPRVLGRYVRDLGVISLEEAIRRMTSLSADQIGQLERGRIREGMFADITVFDPETIEDRATFTDPHQYSIGIHHVLVNGAPVIRSGVLTGAKPGRVLKGPARPAAQ